MILKKDFDETWKAHDFGNGEEKYLLRYYSIEQLRIFAIKYPTFRTSKFFEKFFTSIYISAIRNFETKIFIWVLRDWEGVYISKGKEAVCNNANKTLLMKTSYRRKAWIIKHASDPKTFDIDIDRAVKKSERPSPSVQTMEKTKQNSQAADHVQNTKDRT